MDTEELNIFIVTPNDMPAHIITSISQQHTYIKTETVASYKIPQNS
jgi:hypothetical protein